MDFGIALPTPADSWKTVKRAEDAGFSTAWFYDTQVLSADIFVAMGAAAVKTDRIRLGTGVLIPSNRIVPVAANGLASLNALAPGRILAGFGTGYTGRRSIGLGPYKVSDMGDYTRAVMAMLRGETPEIRIEAKTRKVGFLNPEAGLINIKDPIPVSISALGPKTRRLAAELDADWISVNFTEEFSAATARDMDAQYRAAGKDPARRRKIIFALGAVLKEGEAALYESYTPTDARYLTLHRGHLMFVRPDEDRFATADLIRTLTSSGTAPELRDRIRRLKEAGYDEVVVQVTPGWETMIDDWAHVFEIV